MGGEAKSPGAGEAGRDLGAGWNVSESDPRAKSVTTEMISFISAPHGRAESPPRKSSVTSAPTGLFFETHNGCMYIAVRECLEPSAKAGVGWLRLTLYDGEVVGVQD